MADAVARIREAFGFKLEPMDLGDDGTAFACFLNFAGGNTPEAQALQAAFFEDTATAPRHDSDATPAEVGRYIDWLIQWCWGEARPAQVH